MKRFWIILVAAVILLLLLATVQTSTPAEPEYNGRTLTSYLEGPWEQVDGPQTENPHFAPDEKAIRAIGTNGIPTLLKLIQAKDPAWKTKWFALLKHQSIIHFNLRDAASKRELGFLGFSILGEAAKSAQRDLARLSNDPDTNVSSMAIQCILQMQFVNPPPTNQILIDVHMMGKID